MKQTIYLGLNDQHTKKQVISTKKALSFTTDFCHAYFNGSTISICDGLYKHTNGEKVIEKTIKIELFDENFEVVLLFINHIKKVFNQESILLTTETNIKTEFI